jgi:hypothetical protein
MRTFIRATGYELILAIVAGRPRPFNGIDLEFVWRYDMAPLRWRKT